MAQGSVIKVNGKSGTTFAIRFYGQDGKRNYKTIGPRKGDGRITGMRQSEVLGLEWGDIDWQSAKLTLDIYSHLMEGAEEEAMGRLQERLQFETSTKP